MSEIVDLQECLRRIARAARSDDLAFENFLLEEGLELLASYRSIKDRDIRKAAKAFIDSLAKVNAIP